MDFIEKNLGVFRNLPKIANVVFYFCKMLHHRCLTVLNMPLGGNTHGLTYKSGNVVFISEIWKMSVSMSTKLAFDSFSPT